MPTMPKILLTGTPGVGKTTVVKVIAASGLSLAGGFLTEEVRREGRRLGFRVKDIHSGQEGVLADVHRKGRPRVGKYGVDVDSFERIGVSALRRAMARDGCVLIDEIGKMELCSPRFREVVTELFDSDRPVLATIGVQRHPFLDALRGRPDVSLIRITPANRDGLAGRLIEMLRRPAGGRDG